MKSAKKIIRLFLLANFLLPSLALAENKAIDKLNEIGAVKGPYQQASDNLFLSMTLGTVINALLGIIGAVFLALILYAGFNWMIARGEEEKVEKAKDTITRAIIGIIIVVGAYAIWNYVFQYLF